MFQLTQVVANLQRSFEGDENERAPISIDIIWKFHYNKPFSFDEFLTS